MLMQIGNITLHRYHQIGAHQMAQFVWLSHRHALQTQKKSLPLAGHLQMVGIWCVTVWQQLGQPEQLRLIELGPGRGTLMADLLRGTQVFAPFQKALRVHLVEVRLDLKQNNILLGAAGN